MAYDNSADKEVRKIVFNKYKKRCAYCGIKLNPDNWHIDHIMPLRRKEYDLPNGPCTISNYNPSCPSCNISKGVYSIDKFRTHIAQKIESERRYCTNYKILLRYKLIKETGSSVVFHFERVNYG